MEKLVNFVDSNIKIKEPGFCVKTYYVNNREKLFINFCHSTSVSPPPLCLTEQDLKKLIEEEDFHALEKFSVPLILEGVEPTMDKNGKLAQLTHAIVNSRFYNESLSDSETYQNFLIYITIEIINAKLATTSKMKLDHNSAVILQNKKYKLGGNKCSFNKFINVPKPIQSVSPLNPALISASEKNNESENDNVRISLDLKLNLIEIVFKLTEHRVTDLNKLQLFLNEDRIIVKYNEQVVNDFFLSFNMITDEAVATFKSNVLRLKCPVDI